MSFLYTRRTLAMLPPYYKEGAATRMRHALLRPLKSVFWGRVTKVRPDCVDFLSLVFHGQRVEAWNVGPLEQNGGGASALSCHPPPSPRAAVCMSAVPARSHCHVAALWAPVSGSYMYTGNAMHQFVAALSSFDSMQHMHSPACRTVGLEVSKHMVMLLAQVTRQKSTVAKLPLPDAPLESDLFNGGQIYDPAWCTFMRDPCVRLLQGA